MKKSTLYYIAGTLFAVLITVPLSSFAIESAQFNTDPQDAPTLQVTNYTKNPQCSTCWASSILDVKPSDTVSFAFYYHNTGTASALDTRAQLSFTNNTASVNANGKLWAQNASAVYGSATVSAAPGCTIALNPLVNEYGLGDVAPGWDGSGYLVVRFQITGQCQPTATMPTVITDPATNISAGSATLNGQVNPNSAQTSYWFEWGKTVSLGNTSAAQSLGSGGNLSPVSAGIVGLLANTTYYFRAVAQNQYGISQGTILNFTTGTCCGGGGGGVTPLVLTNPATNISNNTATLNGQINPNGAATSYWFEWGKTTTLGNSSAGQGVGSGSTFTPVSSSIANLLAGTTYYFRLVGQNQYGISYGSILSFTTGSNGGGGGGGGVTPLAITKPATNVSSNTATLNGEVNPNGAATSYWFDWGKTTNFGNSTAGQSVGSGSSNVQVASTISALLPGTVYYFRLVGQNQYGVVYGAILSFATTACGGTSGCSQ